MQAVASSNIPSRYHYRKGDKLLPRILHGQKPHIGISKIKYPNQGMLGDKEWTIWRKAMCQCLQITSERDRLNRPLGDWKETKAPEDWPCWQDSATGNILFRNNSHWEVMQLVRGLQGINQNFPIIQFSQHLPQAIWPARGWRTPNGEFHFFGAAGHRLGVAPHQPSLLEQILLLDNAIKWSANLLEVEGNWHTLGQAIRDHNTCAISDGSFKGTHGTAASTLRSYIDPTIGITG